MYKRGWPYRRAKVRRWVEVKRWNLAVQVGGWHLSELMEEIEGVEVILRHLQNEHYPEGPYCGHCDVSYGAGDGSDGNNPDCPHYARWCTTCRRQAWPCRTQRLLDGEQLDD